MLMTDQHYQQHKPFSLSITLQKYDDFLRLPNIFQTLFVGLPTFNVYYCLAVCRLFWCICQDVFTIPFKYSTKVRAIYTKVKRKRFKCRQCDKKSAFLAVFPLCGVGYGGFACLYADWSALSIASITKGAFHPTHTQTPI